MLRFHSLIFLLVFTFSASGQFYPKLQPLITWEPIVEMEDQLFPSYILASATMQFSPVTDPHFIGDPNGQMGMRIKSDAGNGTFRLEIEAPAIMSPASIKGYIKDQKVYYEAFPKIPYNFNALYSIIQPIPVNVTFKLYVNEEFYDQKIKTIRVHSINDCPFIQIHRKGIALDRNWMFAAYVNENHPWISNQLLPELMKWKIVDSFTGYQVSEEEVIRQVFAIWTEFQKRGFRYSDISTPTVMSQAVRSQYVRFLSETVSTAQANCVDGTALFASILRRIGIKPVIALTPNHCFLGFYLDREKQRWIFLETTLLGTRDVAQDRIDPAYWNTYAGLFGPVAQITYQQQLRSFIYALQVGNKNYVDMQEHLKTVNLLYLIVDVEEARNSGVMPINR